MDETHLVAARPKLLLSVCITQMFAYLATSDAALLPGSEKSI
jgi:hypothetical protein